MSNTPTKIDDALAIVYKLFNVLNCISHDYTNCRIYVIEQNKLGLLLKNRDLYTVEMFLWNIKYIDIPEEHKAVYDEIQEILHSVLNITEKTRELDCLKTEITSILESIDTDLVPVFEEMLDAFFYQFKETFRVCNDTNSRLYIKSHSKEESLFFFTQTYIDSCLENEEKERDFHNLIDKSIRKFEDSKLGFLTILNFLNKKIILII